MSLVGAVNAYLSASLALLVVALLLATFRRFTSGSNKPFRQRHILLMGYALAVAALVLPLLVAVLPARQTLLPEPIQIWTAPTMHAVTPAATHDARLAFSAVPHRLSLPLPAAGLALAAFIALGTMVLLVRVGRDLRTACRIVAAATPLLSRGSAHVFISDTADVPFSLWTPGRSAVLIPAGYTLRPDDLRMALRHEAQHHRQGDTRVVYVLQLLRALFWWHPGVRWLVRHLLELQEFACDEVVTARCDTSPQAYCQCLLRAAEEAQHACAPVGIGMTGATHSALLRRVQTALNRPRIHRSAPVAALVVVSAIATLGAVAAAVPVRDHRLTLEDARRLVDAASRSSGFPLTVNNSVLVELNRLLGTPDGREWLRQSLARMETHQPHIEAQLEVHRLPRALLAVPLVESGYRNREAGIGAGLWMFIAPTARRFGLDVSPDRDERLDIALETDAAMRLLTTLHAQFQDWPLALLAYNNGSGRVEQGMQEAGSPDAWKVAERTPQGAVYLPRVMAAALVLANPDVLDR